MTSTIYRYAFQPVVPLYAAEESLALAVLAAEGIHGEAPVRLDAGYYLDDEHRVGVVDATTRVGETIARVFTAFLRKEFGEDAFTVERVASDRPPIRCAPSAERSHR